MKTGLLWFDDDPSRGLEDKVLRAVAHYEQKHGRKPDLCFVHPSAFNGKDNVKPKKAGTVEIRSGRSVLRHHFWLGQAERSKRRSLTARVEATAQPMTAEKARQLLLALEGQDDRTHTA